MIGSRCCHAGKTPAPPAGEATKSCAKQEVLHIRPRTPVIERASLMAGRVHSINLFRFLPQVFAASRANYRGLYVVCAHSIVRMRRSLWGAIHASTSSPRRHATGNGSNSSSEVRQNSSPACVHHLERDNLWEIAFAPDRLTPIICQPLMPMTAMTDSTRSLTVGRR